MVSLTSAFSVWVLDLYNCTVLSWILMNDSTFGCCWYYDMSGLVFLEILAGDLCSVLAGTSAALTGMAASQDDGHSSHTLHCLVSHHHDRPPPVKVGLEGWIIFWEDIPSHVGHASNYAVIYQVWDRHNTGHRGTMPCCSSEQTMANCGQYQEYLFRLLTTTSQH